MTLPSHALTWALFTAAFFSFLRKSNLVAPSSQTFDHNRHLTRNDIKFTASGCFLRLQWSKTRQHKDGIHIVPLPSIPHSPLCAVTAIHHYFTLVPASPDAPFFCLPTATGLAPVTASFFTSTLKRLISTLGLAAANYSPHSFRWGGATYAYQAGVPEHLLQLHGDWRSDAYKQYLTLPLSTRTAVADIMAAGLHGHYL
jgi:integrase